MERRDDHIHSRPLDTGHALALIARVTRDLDDASDERRDLLLEDLLCAAWPTSTAQDQ